MVPPKGYNWHYWPLRSDLDVSIEPHGSDEVSGQQLYQLSVTPFGWSRPFVLQDRFKKDPESETPAFRAVGRQDDLLVLVNGLKVQPKIFECTVSNSNFVRAALAFGDGEFDIGLIIEPAEPLKDVEKFKRAIWPLVQEACRKMDSHAQISSMASLVVVGPGETLPRSDKGSVLRKEAYRQYEKEIRRVYNKSVEKRPATVSNSNTERLKDTLTALVREELQIPQPLGPEDDFFECGVNSLQVVRIQRGIIGIVKESQGLLPKAKITADLVYRHTTINKLCAALKRDTSPTTDDDLVNEYVSHFSLPGKENKHTVLLTGSSGSLGSYLLSHLVSLPQVSEVVCFIRISGGCDASDLVEQQIEAAEKKGGHYSIESEDKSGCCQRRPLCDTIRPASRRLRRIVQQGHPHPARSLACGLSAAPRVLQEPVFLSPKSPPAGPRYSYEPASCQTPAALCVIHRGRGRLPCSPRQPLRTRGCHHGPAVHRQSRLRQGQTSMRAHPRKSGRGLVLEDGGDLCQDGAIVWV